MNAKRGPGVVKSTTRAAAGGVLVIGALLALLFLRSGGTGQGDAENPEGASPDRPMLATSEAPTDPALTSLLEDDAPGGLTADEKQALTDGVLTLLIDEYEYLMKIPASADSVYRPVELSRAVALAKQAKGDSNGIRVRVQRRESSRASAEHRLMNELQHGGIGSDAVYMASEFVP